MAIKRIMLSAGHGEGQNAGVVGGYREGTRMYDYSLMLKKELERVGFIVGLIRTNIKQNPNLTERGRAAKAFGADLHYMLHSDAAAAAARGVTVLYSIRRPEDRAHAEAITKAIARCMGTQSRSPRYKESTVKRGRDWYTEIDTAVQLGVPHVFSVEHGFHTNPEDCAWLCSDDNLKKLARAEAEAIHMTFNEALPLQDKAQIASTKPEGYLVRIAAEEMNCRSGPGLDYTVNRVIRGKGVYTIVEERAGWGRLKSGAGWIELCDTIRLEPAAAKDAASPASGALRVGEKVRVKAGTRDYDRGRILSPAVYAGVYDVIQINGSRVVIGKGRAVTAAIHRDHLLPV